MKLSRSESVPQKRNKPPRKSRKKGYPTKSAAAVLSGCSPPPEEDKKLLVQSTQLESVPAQSDSECYNHGLPPMTVLQALASSEPVMLAEVIPECSEIGEGCRVVLNLDLIPSEPIQEIRGCVVATESWHIKQLWWAYDQGNAPSLLSCTASVYICMPSKVLLLWFLSFCLYCTPFLPFSLISSVHLAPIACSVVLSWALRKGTCQRVTEGLLCQLWQHLPAAHQSKQRENGSGRGSATLSTYIQQQLRGVTTSSGRQDLPHDCMFSFIELIIVHAFLLNSVASWLSLFPFSLNIFFGAKGLHHYDHPCILRLTLWDHVLKSRSSNHV